MRHREQRGVEMLFVPELRLAARANGEMPFDGGAFLLVHFIANVENQQRGNFGARLILFLRNHRSTPNSLRSLRVARNREFLTVSSLVPRASPMARSFSPW